MANRDQQPPTSNPDDQLKHIAEVTKHARTAWFVLLGFLAFAGVTLLSVKDADFFSYGASTDMPLLGISIPTTYFFSVAPVLIAAFCIHLHLYLLKLWKAVAALPKTIDGRPIDDCVPPWLVTDWALWMRGLRNDAPLNAVSNIITFLLVWFGPLFVLTVFWWRVIPIRDKWLIFATGLFASVTIVIVIACFASALQTLSSVHKPTGENPRLHNRPMWWRLPRRAARLHIRFIRIARSVAQSVSPADYSIGLGLLIAFAMLIVSYDRLENEGRITRLGPASADLRGAELSIKPDDWQSYSDAKADFEAEYRRRLGITGRDAWQGEEEQEFNDTWARHRREYLSKIQSPSLSGRDLREARLEEAFIATVDLRGSRLEGANLYGAHLERADFYEARLQGAFLMAAHLEGANLQRARLERKFLVQAHLEGANLHRAHLEGAILGLTHLD
ncbi:MAG: pentapeptide repeat-containing protein, partial [Phycisphaerales bacterium]